MPDIDDLSARLDRGLRLIDETHANTPEYTRLEDHFVHLLRQYIAAVDKENPHLCQQQPSLPDASPETRSSETQAALALPS